MAATDTAGTMTPPRRRYRDLVDELAGAQKKRIGPPYTVWVNRWFGRRAAALGCLAGLRPNQMTALSAVATAAALVVLALGGATIATGAAVTGLLLLGFVLDSADGQMARLQGGGSLDGEWLDHMIDAVKVTAIHAAVLIHLYRATDLDDAWLLVPLAYASINAGSFAAMIISDLLVRADDAKTASARTASGPAAAPARQSLARSVFLLPADYGVVCWSFLLVASTGAFLVVYVALLVLNGTHFAIASRNRFRELQARSRVR